MNYRNYSPALILFALLISVKINLFSQVTVVNQDSTDYLKKYNTNWKYKDALYMGRQYDGYSNKISGSPYFGSGIMKLGHVLYESVWYYNIPLLFDIYIGELITINEDGKRLILNKVRIDAFEIEGNYFKHLKNSINKNINSGFYKKINTTGSVTAYVKLIKELQEKVDGLSIEKKFEDLTQYYLLSGNQSWQIKKEKHLLSALKNNQVLILQRVKEKRLTFKKDPELFIKEYVNYYNQTQL